MPRVTRAATKARRKKELETRRKAIFDAAAAVFNECGYRAAGADDIAARAGVSVGTVYNFYGNKERLFTTIVEQLGEEVLKHARSVLAAAADVESSVKELVRFRLANLERHRLFFVLLSSSGAAGSFLAPARASSRAASLYYRYLEILTKVVEKGMEEGRLERMRPLSMAISLDGIVSGFVNYWARPDESESPDRYVKRVTNTLLRVLSLKKRPAQPEGEAAEADREVYITRFDFERLSELIEVARTFGGAEQASHLDELANALSRARIVDPRSVPADVTTMNSRVRLRNPATGEETVRSLAFPANASEPQTVSVLEPLGTALLGRRTGATVELNSPNGPEVLEIAEVLYQPESAGHYHL